MTTTIIDLIVCMVLTGSPTCDPLLEPRTLEAYRNHYTTTTTTTPPPPTTSHPQPYRGMGTDVERWRSLVASYFRAEDVERALCLMSYESGGNPNAKNPTSSARGLMQILGSLWAPHFGVTLEELYDPHINLAIAAQIRDSQGWTAWAPYNRGLCR